MILPTPYFDNANELHIHNEENEESVPNGSTDSTTQTQLSSSASASENPIAPFNYDTCDSTVASESVFSNSHCTIDESRSRMSHNTLETFVYLVDWYVQDDRIVGFNIDKSYVDLVSPGGFGEGDEKR
ncbi:hypothetical protein M9H77_31062 [Catharanthus roseus]|uniref:Uncharacterized protein n=1 Tax=Catharanthus roseus TaxID=4058 RepID=A0ACB9ZZ04_CATRO|nr:hypothetical protein M9H77_31062 [Catharanthus roseus]